MQTKTNIHNSATTPLARKMEQLADDAHAVTLDLELARFAAGELCDGYFDLFDENDPSDLQEFTEKLLVGYRYPLIELGMDRDECLYEIGQAGWPLPTRSSCVFCPMQTRKQWERQRNLYPQDWAKVLKVEALIRAEAPDVFLCRECVPMEDWLATPPA